MHSSPGKPNFPGSFNRPQTGIIPVSSYICFGSIVAAIPPTETLSIESTNVFAYSIASIVAFHSNVNSDVTYTLSHFVPANSDGSSPFVNLT